MRRADTGVLSEQLKAQGRAISDFGDPQLIAIQGGLVINDPETGALLGGIGVGGLPTGKEDEDISRVGLAALKL